MSILLEALRKTENSQKPVEPPTIHDNGQLVHEPGPIKSSYVILLVIIALIVIGWLLWSQYHADEAGYRPPVTMPSGKSGNKVPVAPGKTQSEPASAGASKTAEVATKTSEKVASNDTQRPAQSTAGRPRTPVETYKLSEEEKDEIRAQRESLRRQKIAADNRASRAAAAKQAEARSASAAEAGEAETKSTAATQPAGAKSKNSSKNAEEYQSPEPEPIGYWELPDSVRNGVPEIKFSVLVYADNPKNRFVLVNGTRLVEGDELKPGVKVEEIRREGVVFSSRLYRFFVER